MPAHPWIPCLALPLVVALATGASSDPASPAVPQSARPTPPAALSDAARALAAGDLDRALELARAHLETQPRDADARVLAARVQVARGDLDAAYRELRGALADSPRHVDALYYMGLVAASLAQAEFERLSTLAPESGRAHQLLAESLEAQGSNPAAEQEYEAAIRAQPDLVDALLGLARLKRIRLACEEAVTLYEKAEAIRPTFEGAYGLGVCLGYVQKHDEAVRRFEQATRRAPRAAIAWAGLGAALTRLGRPADAIRKLQRAIELEPRMGEAYYALGLAYQAAGQPEQAKAAFRKAEELGGAVGR